MCSTGSAGLLVTRRREDEDAIAARSDVWIRYLGSVLRSFSLQCVDMPNPELGRESVSVVIPGKGLANDMD